MLEGKIIETIKKYKLINANDKLVLGISGGPDSISMLNVLYTIKEQKMINFDFVVCHINHMIREEAIDDEMFVNNFCKKREIPFFTLRANVEEIAKQRKNGTEEAGRKIRYDFFEEILQKTKSNKIATAHNLNDNAETVLLNIIRGSGINGLKGIEPIRDNKFIRPLIECNREEIENYCMENNLTPRIDKTNKENFYTRNKVRNLLLPFIKENFNSNIIDTINRLSTIARDEAKFLDNCARGKYNEILVKKEKDDVKLDLKKFNLMDKVLKAKVILIAIEEVFGYVRGIEKIHIEDILKMCEKNIGNKVLYPNKNVKVFVRHGILQIGKNGV